ncbi:MAG: protein kinase [Pirellulaceae bacterium]
MIRRPPPPRADASDIGSLNASRLAVELDALPPPPLCDNFDDRSAGDDQARGDGALLLLPGSRLGDYELLDEIARGGMGVVYRAVQRGLDRIVAVKVIRDSALAGPDDVARFKAEAAAAAGLRHPHIVAIHEVGSYRGRHFFSMDYIDGTSLATHAREQPLSAGAAAALVVTIAGAVQAAHDQGVLHRDLKPSNVLMDRAGQPHVTDFGLAKRLAGGSELTSTEQVLGTPSYMPPEQARADRGQIGFASDVYSLGAILYELLTGRPPFRGDTALATIQQVLESEPVSPRRLNPAVSRDLQTICCKCLEKAPGNRYASAQALADDLNRFLRQEPILARRITAFGRSAKWARRRPAVTALLVAVLLVAIAGISGILWQWHAAADARDKLGRALQAKSRLFTEAEAARQQADRSARASQRVSEILIEVCQGTDRTGTISDFFLTTPDASAERISGVGLLDRAAGHVAALGDAPLAQAELMNTLGVVYLSLGQLEKAADMLQSARDVRQPLDAVDGPAAAKSLAYLGVLRYLQGRYDEAEQLAQEVLASDHADVTDEDQVLLLGMLELELDESDATIREVERLVLAASHEEKRLGPQAHRQRALLLGYLSLIRERRNEHKLAVPLAHRIQESIGRVEGSEHFQQPFVRWVAGMVAIQLEQREFGIAQVRGAVADLRREVGDAHPTMQIFLPEMARLFEMLFVTRGDPWFADRAEEFYRIALECLQQGCGRQPRAAMCMERLAGLLEKRNRNDEAARLLGEALTIRTAILGTEHRDTIRTQQALSGVKEGG